jgi:DNA-binding MarR family transcriptional regulator/N-acetylglutamate synthase-like GNAT family acetyltransferase
MDTEHIEQVRRFNRLVTQRVGALEESYLRRGRRLGEARLIFETRAEGAELRALRNRLGLDSGYLSRLLRSLEAQGLVTVERESADRRRRRVRLTSEGRAELAAYDRLSDELAASMLAPLGAHERERLLAAMAEIERLIRAAAIEIRVVSPNSAAARRCLAAYFRELAARFKGGFNPSEGDPAPEQEMTPPNGFFVLARIDGRAVGCGGLRRIDERVGEIKRMWTAPEARGQGVARRVLLELEALARDAGIKTLRLDTNRVLAEAQAMYRREGYREIARYNDNPYAHHWFERNLEPTADPT